jgi:hypothetical protein
MLHLFNADAIRALGEQTTRGPGGYRFGFVNDVLNQPAYYRLAREFPPVHQFQLVDKHSGGGRKRFYVGPTYELGRDGGCTCGLHGISETWKELFLECASAELMELLGVSTGIYFNSLSSFGFAYGNAGCMQEPHIDGSVRPGDASPVHSTISLFIYCNPSSQRTGGTRMYAPDRESVLFEVPELRNGLFYFEQNALAWHGYAPLPPGIERRLVNFTYTFEESPVALRTSRLHRHVCIRRFRRRLRRAAGALRAAVSSRRA